MIGKLGEFFICFGMREMGGLEGMRGLDRRAEVASRGLIAAAPGTLLVEECRLVGVRNARIPKDRRSQLLKVLASLRAFVVFVFHIPFIVFACEPAECQKKPQTDI